MKGSKKVVDTLNRLLTDELSAADQYFIHSRMYENWGLHALYHRIEHEREEELEHASRLIRRILFLEGTPDIASRAKLKIGSTVPEVLKNSLASETAARTELVTAIAKMEAASDFVSRDLLEDFLEETEERIDFYETQIELITKVGLPNYLQSAVGELSE